MGKYLVTSGSVFTPFSYDEITKPLAQMAEAHGKVQDAYDTIATESEALRHYIEQEPEDSRARAMYDGYMRKLQTLQDNLWQNGYTAQSRRDLSAARAGYASDVTRLASAIKQRQDKSKVFNDARLKDPTLITGRDPGLDPLDRFLEDDTYGSNWYSYSGKDFQKEVSDDAKERAEEWVKENAYLSGVDPNIPGYIIQKVSEGFSSDDVTYARDFASAFAGLYRNPKTRTKAAAIYEALQEGVDFNGDPIPDSSRILTGVLLNHLFASGVMNSDVADSELARQINYGANGLSSAIGKTTITNLQDYDWIYSHDPSKTGNGRKNGDDDDAPTRTYSTSGVIVESGRTKQAARISSRLNKSFYSSYLDANGNPQPQHLIVPDGSGGNTARVFNDFVEATEYIYHTPERQAMLDKYGLDVANMDSWDKNDLGYSAVPVSDVTERARLKNKYGSAVEGDSVFDYLNYLIKKDGVVDPMATVEFANAYKTYGDRINTLNELNKDRGIKLDKLAMSPAEEQKLRKKYDIDPRIDWRDVPTVIASKAKSWTVSDPTLANHKTPDMLKQVEKWILLTYNGGGPNGRASRLRFRKVDADTSAVDSKGTEHGLKDVFDTDKNGNIQDGSLLGVNITPENMINGEITIITKKGKFVCSMDYLGADMKNALAGTLTYLNGRNEPAVTSMSTAIRTLAMPLYDTEAVLLGNEGGKFDPAMWKGLLHNFTNDTLAGYGLLNNRNGRIYDPEDIVRNDELMTNLYRLIRDYIGMKCGSIIDDESLHVNEVASHSAGKNPSRLIEETKPKGE